MPFVPNPPGFHAGNAAILAQLANAAYLDENGAAAAAGSLGFPDFQWIDLNKWFEDLYGFAASNETAVILVFRGTHEVRDWMDDLRATPVRFSWLFEGAPEIGDVHAGFGHTVRDAWDRINAALDAVAPQPPRKASLDDLANTTQRTFWITGHSLGAALGVLTAAGCSMLPGKVIRPINGIYTFGQPRVGLHTFCGNYDHMLQSKTFRFVNKQDLVPRVPFRGWDYADLGQMIHFDDQGAPHLESPQWNNLLARSFESFRDFFSIVGNVKTDVGDHSMDGYEKLVASQVGALDALFA